MTLTETELQQLLTRTADEFEVPPFGIERILAADQVPRRARVRRTRGARASTMAVGLASLAVVGGLGFGLVSLSGGGHHSSGSTSGASVGIAAGPAEAAPPRAADGAVAAPEAGAAAPQAGAAPAVPVPQAPAVSVPAAKLVRTGTAALTVGKGSIPAAQAAIERAATGEGGIVASEQTSSGTAPSASLTLRVPGDRYQDLVAAVRAAGTVTSLQTQAADVTSQYTDLQARITALEATRDTYLTLLSKASSIGDTLSVQQRLDDVQTQLEELQGQQKVLADQTALGTLDVTITERGASSVVPAGGGRGPWSRAWHSARHAFAEGVRGLVVASGPLAFALLLGAVGVVGWRAGRRFWRRSRV